MMLTVYKCRFIPTFHEGFKWLSCRQLSEHSLYVKCYPLFSCVAKNCMKICIQNMLKMSEHVHGLILAEVAVSVFSFVKDSYPNTPALFEEFENNDGYTILQAIMARYISFHFL